MRGLDRLQLVHQRVVLGVGDLRRIEDVIEVLVAAQFGAQFLGAIGRTGLHGCVVAYLRTHPGNYRGGGQGSMVGSTLWNLSLIF